MTVNMAGVPRPATSSPAFYFTLAVNRGATGRAVCLLLRRLATVMCFISLFEVRLAPLPLKEDWPAGWVRVKSAVPLRPRSLQRTLPRQTAMSEPRRLPGTSRNRTPKARPPGASLESGNRNIRSARTCPRRSRAGRAPDRAAGLSEE